jgi:GTPase SAR1 family protein
MSTERTKPTDFYHPDRPAQEAADRLRGRTFNRICILERPNIPSVIAGFILTEIGVISPDAQVVVRSDPNKEQLSLDLQNNSIPLFSREFTDPFLLIDLIEDGNPNWTQVHQNRLRWLAHQNQSYRSFGDDKWFVTRRQFTPKQEGRMAIHDILSLILLTNRDNPRLAYQRAQDALRGRLIDIPQHQNTLAPIKLEVPFLKGTQQTDDVRPAIYQFDPRRILLLTDQHFSLVIGGPPNCGKSTFAVSLFEAMQGIVKDCIERRIISPDDLSVGICDLDLAAPTVRYIQERRDVPTDRKRPWDESLMTLAVDLFGACKEQNNVVIGDLPGGIPDQLTARFAALASFSTRVFTRTDPKTDAWKEFLIGANLPTKLIEVHTRLHEPDKKSGVRNFQARSRGKRRDFLRGRMVDLERVAKPDDPFIQFAAHALLLDFLPDQVLGRLGYGHKIANSLDLMQPVIRDEVKPTTKRVGRLLREIDQLPPEEAAMFLSEVAQRYNLSED